MPQRAKLLNQSSQTKVSSRQVATGRIADQNQINKDSYALYMLKMDSSQNDYMPRTTILTGYGQPFQIYIKEDLAHINGKNITQRGI